MITETKKITSKEQGMTEGQKEALDQLFKGARQSLKLSKFEAQEILKQGDKAKGKFKEILRNLSRNHSPINKLFGLPVMSFELIVHEDYGHENQIGNFLITHKDEFQYVSKEICDECFKNAPTKLRPGENFKVSIYPIIETVQEKDCMEFLKSQHNVLLVGAQGLTLIWPHIKYELPKGASVLSFDTKEALWKNRDNRYMVPKLVRRDYGNWNFLVEDSSHWFRPPHEYLLCFRSIGPKLS